MKAARLLRGERPGLPVLLLSQYVDAEGAMDLVADGADGVGYLLKQRVMEVERFVEACRLVASGGSIIDPEIVASMMGRRRVDDPVDRLTPRQLEVLGLMAEGRSNAAIAGQLFITEKAVARHINAIFHTLGLPPARDDHRRVLAVLSYLNR
jgi:DNA-binding NarL/FixJ family response regulator